MGKAKQRLGLMGNYEVIAETENFVVLSSNVNNITPQESIEEFEMLKSFGFDVMCFDQCKLWCKKMEEVK